jgi:hypothetical protein
MFNIFLLSLLVNTLSLNSNQNANTNNIPKLHQSFEEKSVIYVQNAKTYEIIKVHKGTFHTTQNIKYNIYTRGKEYVAIHNGDKKEISDKSLQKLLTKLGKGRFAFSRRNRTEYHK